jgi:uncharacterized membrane protein
VKRVKGALTLPAAVMLASILLAACGNRNTDAGSAKPETVKDGDIVIPIERISETAVFYPAEIDGVELEVIAVRAPDGTIRTAFNTCQVCYSSGRGYYEQEGTVLVCQNCGNRFSMDRVEVESGGCNPVPIFDENKTVDESGITVGLDFLRMATVIFSNWKTDY